MAKVTARDEIGDNPKREALRELATLADGAANGDVAVLTHEGVLEMRKLAAALWLRYRNNPNE